MLARLDALRGKAYVTVKSISSNLLLVGALGVVISISRCATKTFVRDTVSPVETKVGEIDQRTTQNTEQIGNLDGELDREVPRINEQLATALEDAKTADGKAVDAQASADRAAAKANEVEASSSAGFDRVGQTLRDMANYSQAAHEAVLFGFDSSSLSDEGKAQLARAAAAAAAGKNVFVIEVRGFTDSTGSADYNVRLSERRAEEVVRTLAAEHNIPLRAISRLGLGSITGENTREAREQNRRVDVTLYAPANEW
jgi:outer membrane protein OmpA-like peptidoglycan-associated protein